MKAMLDKKKKKKRKKLSDLDDPKDSNGSMARTNLDRARMRMLMNNNLLEYARMMTLSKDELDIIEKQFYLVRHRVLDTQSRLLLAKEVQHYDNISSNLATNFLTYLSLLFLHSNWWARRRVLSQ